MNFAGFQLWSENRHHVLMLLDTAQACEGFAFNADFVVIVGAGQIGHIHGPVRISLAQAVFHLLWCHSEKNYQRLLPGAS